MQTKFMSRFPGVVQCIQMELSNCLILIITHHSKHLQVAELSVQGHL